MPSFGRKLVYYAIEIIIVQNIFVLIFMTRRKKLDFTLDKSNVFQKYAANCHMARTIVLLLCLRSNFRLSALPSFFLSSSLAPFIVAFFNQILIDSADHEYHPREYLVLRFVRHMP